MRKAIVLFFTLFVTLVANAQIISIDPPLFTIDEEITIIYDATQGSAGLVGVSPVYAHTGVITSAGGPGNWQYVQGNWGTADARVVMAPIGNDRHLIQFTPRDFYSIPDGEEVVQLAFVFRNQDGSKEGKTTALSDIFIDVPDLDAFTGKFINPDEEQLVVQQGDQVSISAAISMESSYVLYDNGLEILSGTGTEINFDYVATVAGNHTIRFEATDGQELAEDSFSIVVLDGQAPVGDIPQEVDYGATILSDGSILLRLHAPEKDHVFALTDLTEFKIDAAFQMTNTPDGDDWWIQLQVIAGKEDLLYQYLVDGTIKIADPYSSLILDNFNDSGIDDALDAVPLVYPIGLTSGHLSYLDLTPEEFVWQNAGFTAAPDEDLVIYELLMRDFLEDHSYDSLIDTLSYLSNLGVNAIELMPVSEFENNDSWGYNPSYHMALDKYYGNPTSFKRLVDAAHGLGMAVILDIVYNHAFGQSPLVRLYWDASNSRPAESSPYFNPIAKHPFNVGFDFNHDMEATQTYTKQTIDYWLEEYHVDGFRFDLSKGFTQRFSSENGAFSAYDAERIARLTDYGNHIWQQKPESILILEHFAGNTEERELAQNGFLLWGNANFNANEASMGWNAGNQSDFSHVYHTQRGYDDPKLIGYMESHDEERLMYKNLSFGNSSSDYNVQELSIGLRRNALTAAFFMSIPGPKMLWQFGELGYDFSINNCTDGTVNENCRLARKPIRWDYAEDGERASLFYVYQQLFKLKASHPAIDATADVNLSLTGVTKSIVSSHEGEHLFVIGNFDVVPQSISVDLPVSGEWFDYISGNSITTGTSYTVTLAPGEYHIYLSNSDFLTSTEEPITADNKVSIYPNPAQDVFTIELDVTGPISVELYNLSGQRILTKRNSYSKDRIDISSLRPGLYLVQVISGVNTLGTYELVVIE